MKALHRLTALFLSMGLLTSVLPVSTSAASTIAPIAIENNMLDVVPAEIMEEHGAFLEDDILNYDATAFDEFCLKKNTPTMLMSLTETLSGYCGGEGDGTNLTWTFDEATGTLSISGTGDMAHYAMYGAPWDDYNDNIFTVTISSGVTSIGDNSFYSCSNMLSVEIPDSVTSIGESAFDGCDGLTSVEIPDSVTSIGKSAFDCCYGLTDVTIPDSVTSISDRAFACCYGLSDMTIPDTVTSIGEEAFYFCKNLTDITIPSSVTTIGDRAFGRCKSLTTITVSENNTRYCSEDGVLFDKQKTTLIQYPAGKQGITYVIPDSVTSFGYQAFAYCEALTSVTIPDSVTSIGEDMFFYCGSLTNVTIPDSVTSIGKNAFFYCVSLTDVNIPDRITVINESTFYHCESLTSVVIPDSVTSIGEWAFAYCKNLTDITIPDGVTSINNWMFAYCYRLTSVNIPESVTSIGENVFYDCDSLTSVDIPNSVTSIGQGAFYHCSNLTLMIIPDSVTAIDSYAFYYCKNLSSVFFVDDAPLTFGNNAFYYCAEGFTIYYAEGASGWTDSSSYDAETDTWNGYQINIWNPSQNIIASGYCGGEGDGTNLSWTLTIYGTLTIDGEGAMEDFAWDSSGPWFEYNANITQLVIEEGVTSIGATAFDGCSKLNGQLRLPSTLISIKADAFAGCGFDGTLQIPDGVTSIGGYAFGCNNFTSVIIPKSVETIGEVAFEDCDSLESFKVDSDSQYYSNDEYGVLFDKKKETLIKYPGEADYTTYTIPEGVSVIEDAFEDCDNLESIFLPNSVMAIDDGNFMNCDYLCSLQVAEQNKWFSSDEKGVLYNYDKTIIIRCPEGLECESYTLPDTVVKIGHWAFYHSKIEDLILSANVTTIADRAFQGSSFTGDGINRVYFKGNAPSELEEDAFSSCVDNFTIYYVEGTSGWTDSEYYDADAGTWYGYELATWDPEAGCTHSDPANFDDVYINDIDLIDNGDGLTHYHSYNAAHTCLSCGTSTGTVVVTVQDEPHHFRTKTSYETTDEEHCLMTTEYCACGYEKEPFAGEWSAHVYNESDGLCECGVTKTASEKDDPSVQVLYDGHTYQLFNKTMTWREAKAYCEELGGHLVTINSENEQEALVTLLQSSTHTVTATYDEYSFDELDLLNCYWIGAEKTSGNWKWVTGEKFSFTNWKPGEPNNENNAEYYAEMYANTPAYAEDTIEIGQWNDAILNGRNGNQNNSFYTETSVGFICEWESALSTWDFNKDSYSFTNSFLAFGSGPIYISTDDMSDYLSLLSETSIAKLATSYVDNPNSTLSTSELEERLWNCRLTDWGGSCYGMSLTASLFKVGIAQPGIFDATNTFEIPKLWINQNSDVESWINIFQISVALQNSSLLFSEEGHSSNFPLMMQVLWTNATGNCSVQNGSTPFPVYLAVDMISNNGVKGFDHAAHAVLCYGAEVGNWNEDGSVYDKRLLISDPNDNSKAEYIYISEDFSETKYTGRFYNTYGLYPKTLSKLSVKGIDMRDTKTETVLVPNMGSFSITSAEGTAIFEDGRLVSDTLGVRFEVTCNVPVEGNETSSNMRIILPDSTSFVISSTTGEAIDAAIFYGDIMLRAAGKIKSVELTADGMINIMGAEGDILFDIVQDEGNIDCLSVKGEGSGDITIKAEADQVNVSGEWFDCTAYHIDRNLNATSIGVSGNSEFALLMDEANVLTVKSDENDDGVFETTLQSVTASFISQENQVTVDAFTPDSAAYAFVSVYDINGKMLCTKLLSPDDAGTIHETIEIEDRADTMKIFVVDSNWKPLCSPIIKTI